MNPKVHTVAFRHAAWLMTRMGRSRGRIVVNLLTMCFVSIGLPWMIGLEFLGAFVVIALTCLSVFLVADLVVDSFISYPGGLDSREFAGKAIACILIGWIFGLTMMFAGLAGRGVVRLASRLSSTGPSANF